MKVAICVSGQPRYFEQGYIYLSKSLINVYKPDIFIHAWQEPIGSRYEGVSKYGMSGIYDQIQTNTYHKILDLYQPKSYIFEPQRQFNQPGFVTKSLGFVTKSLFFSIKKCNELKQTYEKANNFKYDCVLRTRFDLRYRKCNSLKIVEINLDQFNLDHINARIDTFTPKLLAKEKAFVCDNFAFSNSQNMDVYSSCYDNLDYLTNYSTEQKSWFPERILAKHLISKKLDCYNVIMNKHFDFEIIRQKGLWLFLVRQWDYLLMVNIFQSGSKMFEI